MANTERLNNINWDTFHENGPFKVETHYTTKRNKVIFDLFEQYRDAAQEIQRLLQESLANGKGFRAYGSTWSLSYIAHHKDCMHNNALMDIKINVQENNLHPNTNYASKNLFFFQCGNRISAIHQYLKDEGPGQSLKASGASSGQTIAGVMSTGVHGSAFEVGSVHDSIVGINLIIGPAEKDSIYLERASRPAVNDQFAEKLGARVIRDDELFNAALVGLGSFGFIHGVVIETEDIYLLKRYVKTIKKEDAIKLAESLDFQAHKELVPADIEENQEGETPYHYKVFVNPYNDDEDYMVEFMYKKEYHPNYDNPIENIQKGLLPCLPSFLAKIAAKKNYKIPELMESLENEIFPKDNLVLEGTLGEIFAPAVHRGGAFAISFGVDYKLSGKVLDILVDVAKNKGPVPGAYALRFVKASEATLAFTRFPITCAIEMDGILWREDLNPAMITLKELSQEMIKSLQAEQIEFTMHWGKNADWAYEGLVDYMYGDRAKVWKQQRQKLFAESSNPFMAQIFSNKFLNDTKLSEPPVILNPIVT